MTNYDEPRGGYSRSGVFSRQSQGRYGEHESRGRHGREKEFEEEDRGRIYRDRDEDFEGEYEEYEPEYESEGEYERGRMVRHRRTGRRGFASMDEEQQREIASMGGRAAHEYGTAHEFSSEEARKAGRRGGVRTRQTHGRGFYQEIGRIGGEERRRELGPEGYAELGSMGGRARWEERVSRRQGVKGRGQAGRRSQGQGRPVRQRGGRVSSRTRSRSSR